MCTAVTYHTKDFYFGRNLDYERTFGESVVVMPRNFPLKFHDYKSLKNHYAIIGMAHVREGYPLYYDAVNEKGLCIAGLNFVGNAFYGKPTIPAVNIAQFELIPWLLATCADVDEVKHALKEINITDTPFCDGLAVSQLHWMAADRLGCITIEAISDGVRVYDNLVGVLTNNPPFPVQMFSLNNYLNLSAGTPKSTFADGLPLEIYSRGMGAIGLPGDLSSQSRFVRAAFVKLNSRSANTEAESVSQLFHILASVEQTRGCCEVGNGKYEITVYSSCCNADKGIYYYKTYDNSTVTAVDMKHENLDGNEIAVYPLETESRIIYRN